MHAIDHFCFFWRLHSERSSSASTCFRSAVRGWSRVFFHLAKLVAHISAGKHIYLSYLMPANLLQVDPEPQLLFDGRAVLTSGMKRNRCRIQDKISWVEAFTLFTTVPSSFLTHRWRDSTAYKLLILRTYRQLAGRVWLSYDQTFRANAAATNLTDWSSISINLKLFNFHAPEASARQAPRQSIQESPEAVGSHLAEIVCKSWNQGTCTPPYSSCKYAHICADCVGNHWASPCPDNSRFFLANSYRIIITEKNGRLMGIVKANRSVL